MKQVLVAVLLMPLTNVVFAQSKANKNSPEQLLIQMELDWNDADVKKDAVALNRIMADDWMGIDFQGTVMTKAQVMRDLHSDATATESTDVREIKVRIFGNTGIVSGTEVEKSQYKGQDSSGAYIWTDVFVQRNGRWQAVSSQSTKLAEGAKLFARASDRGGLSRRLRTRARLRPAV